MVEIKFFSSSGQMLFVRSDLIDGHWVQEEMTVTASFTFDTEKKIERGQRIAFADPATGNLEVFEIRKVTNYEPDHSQQITAESIAVSELSDDHMEKQEITDKTPTQALTSVLTGTLWSVGNVTATNISSADISRGNVWQAVNTVASNWNVYIVPRVTFSSSGNIAGRYLDVIPAHGTYRGVRLSIDKNMSDATVDYDDTEVLTAMYGFGGSVDKPRQGGEDETEELTFADAVWEETAEHPAKPSGQTYLEWPEKTNLYGRNGRPRFGYYQNGSIKDAGILLEKTWEELKKTADPKISISGSVVDLYRLGYADQPMRLHDTAIVEIRQTGETFAKEIIRLDIDLVDPGNTRPEIGDYIPNIIYINRETDKKASGGGGGGGRGSTNQEQEKHATDTMFLKTHNQIGMLIGTVNGDYFIRGGEIVLAINESGTTGSYETTALINADHINISGTSDVYTLAGDLYHDAQGRLVIQNAGGLYVKRTSGGTDAYFGVYDQNNLTAGILVNKLNDGSTSVKIRADAIDLEGYVTADSLQADIANLNSLNTNGPIYAYGGIDTYGANVECGQCNADNVVADGSIQAVVSMEVAGKDVETELPYVTNVENVSASGSSNVTLRFTLGSGDPIDVNFNKAGDVITGVGLGEATNLRYDSEEDVWLASSNVNVYTSAGTKPQGAKTLDVTNIYTAGYAAGWAAARLKCSYSESGGHGVVYFPPAAVNGSAVASHWFGQTLSMNKQRSEGGGVVVRAWSYGRHSTNGTNWTNIDNSYLQIEETYYP